MAYGYFELDPVQDLGIKQQYQSVFRTTPAPLHESHSVTSVAPFHEDPYPVKKHPDIYDKYHSVFRKTPSPIVHDYAHDVHAVKPLHNDLHAVKKPYEVNHYHYGHKHHYETHIPLKYPVNDHHHHEFEEFFGHPGDKIQKEILAINDPWLPDAHPVLATPSIPPVIEPYREFDVSHLKTKPKAHHFSHYNADYELFGNENYDYLDEPQGPGFTLPGTSFHENFGTKDVITPYIKNHDDFQTYYKSKSTKKPFIGNILLSTTKPKRPRPTKLSFKYKGRPAVKPTLAPLINLLTTLNPFKSKHKRPTKAPSIKKTTAQPSFLGTPLPKLPDLGEMTHGYKKFIDQQGNKAMGFINGLLGKSDKVQRDMAFSLIEDKAKAQRRLGFIDDKTKVSIATYDRPKTQFSSGGHRELSRLEQIKLLLKEARDRPLL